MFDTARPIDNARLGTYTPGAATVNLRGLGPNRSLTLVDGRRAIPSNASGAVDLNTIPQIVIDNIEVITGGASSVYGADALAGVTNIKIRNNFEGMEVRARGGVNEAGGDGKEWQFSTLMGLEPRGQGPRDGGYRLQQARNLAVEEPRLVPRTRWTSPLSNSGDYLFGVYPGRRPVSSAPTATRAADAQRGDCPGRHALHHDQPGAERRRRHRTTCSTTRGRATAPPRRRSNQVFFDRTCGTTINCVTNLTPGGFYFNPDGTMFTRQSNGAAVAGITPQYGPQSYTGPLGGTRSGSRRGHV